jgi:hypothetical protein
VNTSAKHMRMIGNLDKLCDMMGLEYAEEFDSDDIHYELYRSSDERVLGSAPTLRELYAMVRNIASYYS